VIELALVALLGGFCGLMVVALFQPGGQLTSTDLVSVVAGALLAVGIDRIVRA
jgi:hypothetical protein